MIRINLLPFRLARKKEDIRKQVSIFLLLIVLTGTALFWYTQMVNQQISDIKKKTNRVNQQISKYNKKAARVAEIKKVLKILEKKLRIVASLKKQSGKQRVLFDAMTELIIPDRMWLESLITTDTHVTIKGIAFDNSTIAAFMEKLEASVLFSEVYLKTAKMKKFKNDKMLKLFELLCKKEIPKNEAVKDLEKGKK